MIRIGGEYLPERHVIRSPPLSPEHHRWLFRALHLEGCFSPLNPAPPVLLVPGGFPEPRFQCTGIGQIRQKATSAAVSRRISFSPILLPEPKCIRYTVGIRQGVSYRRNTVDHVNPFPASMGARGGGRWVTRSSLEFGLTSYYKTSLFATLILNQSHESGTKVTTLSFLRFRQPSQQKRLGVIWHYFLW